MNATVVQGVATARAPAAKVAQVKAPPVARVLQVQGTAVKTVAARVVQVQAQGTRPTVPATRIRTWRVIGRGKVQSLDGLGQAEGSAIVGGEPTPAQLSMMLDAGNVFLDMACDACRPFLAFATAGALYAYERGTTPVAIWGPLLARSFARFALVAGGLIKLRPLLVEGVASFVLEGDTLVVHTGTPLGWVSNSYITGDPDPRVQPTALDRFGFATGAVGLTSVIAGPVAAAEAVVDVTGATAEEAGRAVAAGTPAAIRGAGAVSSAAGAAAAGRSVVTGWRNLMEFTARTDVIKWGAVAIAAAKVPDAINAFRGATTRATEAGTNAAGALVQHGIATNNPDEIAAGLGALKQFQQGANEGEKYLYAVGGFAAAEILRRR